MRFKAFYGAQLLGEIMSLFTCGAVYVVLARIDASRICCAYL